MSLDSHVLIKSDDALIKRVNRVSSNDPLIPSHCFVLARVVRSDMVYTSG